MIRKIMYSMALAAASLCAMAQTPLASERDSLMSLAREWRDAGNYTEAISLYGRVKTDKARLEAADTYLEMGNVVAALERAKRMRKDDSFALKSDAMLIEARCRQRQGFDHAARMLYRKLARAGHAEAMFYYAAMLRARGSLPQAEHMCQRAIRADASLTPAHCLLSEVEEQMGHRYQALLSLMRYLLMASDQGREEHARRLPALWRRGSRGLDVLGRRKAEEPYSESMEAVIDSVALAEPQAEASPQGVMDALGRRTEALLGRMRDTGEDNLDFWQVSYADFLIEIYARGYTKAMVYFMFDQTYKPEVLLWLSENAGYFEDFRVWMEGRSAGL